MSILSTQWSRHICMHIRHCSDKVLAPIWLEEDNPAAVDVEAGMDALVPADDVSAVVVTEAVAVSIVVAVLVVTFGVIVTLLLPLGLVVVVTALVAMLALVVVRTVVLVGAGVGCVAVRQISLPYPTCESAEAMLKMMLPSCRKQPVRCLLLRCTCIFFLCLAVFEEERSKCLKSIPAWRHWSADSIGA